MRGMDQPTRLEDLMPNWIAQVAEHSFPADAHPAEWVMQNYRDWLVPAVCDDLRIAWEGAATASCELDRLQDPRLENAVAVLSDVIDALIRVHATLDILPVCGSDPAREAGG
jgi:hypothetical protein